VLQPLADGVWAWIQPGGGSGISNAGVVADDDGLTVFDCLMVRSQWEPFAAAVNELGAPVRRLVYSHAHIDHVGGSRSFPLAAVYGSPATSALMEQPPMTEAYKAFMPAFSSEFDDLAEMGTRKVTHEVVDNASLTPRVEVLPAAGHTQGDLMVLVAEADVLFAGDLCFFGVTPLAFQGDPAAWAEVLGPVADLAERIVPGHGPIGGEVEVAALTDYLTACVEAKGDPAAVPSGPWDSWIERQRDEVNVERAAMLARGEPADAIPVSMLRAIGLG
jgi:cyclase